MVYLNKVVVLLKSSMHFLAQFPMPNIYFLAQSLHFLLIVILNIVNIASLQRQLFIRFLYFC